MANKYEEKPSLEDMRFELSEFTKITPNTPDGHVRALYKLYKGATDPQRPNWSRYECELLFEYVADGNDDTNYDIQALRNQIARNAEFEGDLMGRFDDESEDSI
jgi:hypothetical protein